MQKIGCNSGGEGVSASSRLVTPNAGPVQVTVGSVVPLWYRVGEVRQGVAHWGMGAVGLDCTIGGRGFRTVGELLLVCGVLEAVGCEL